ncbi:MAG: sulfatase [Planctomycetota bacterium]|jgi:arylsulfatase
MRATTARNRRRAGVGAGLAALLLVACAGGERAPLPARSLLEALDQARVIPGDAWTRETERELIALGRTGFAPLATGVDPAAFDPAPRLEFGQGALSLAAQAELDGAPAVLAEFEWSFALDVPSGSLQSELVFLDGPIDHADLDGTLARVVDRELASVPIESTGRARLTLARSVPAGATHVALVAHRAVEGPGRAELRQARAVTPSFAVLVEAARQPGRGTTTRHGVERGWFQSQMIYRPGAALPPGGGVVWPVEVPDAPGRVELVLGLLDHPLADLATRVSIQGRFAEQTFTELAALQLPAEGEGQWHRVALDWPAEYAGETVGFELRAEVAGPGFALPVACAPRWVPEDPTHPGRDLVMFSLDTLRADHLGCYGYARETSPHTDALAARGLRFADVWAESAYTLPTHTTLFTGQHAAVHGVYGAGDVLDGGRSPLLAELLLSEGYATGAFTGGGFLLPKFGLHEGYERYGVVDVQWNRESSRLKELVGELEGLTEGAAEAAHPDRVAAWVAARGEQPSFLFVHTYAPHEFDAPRADREALGIEGPALEDDPVALAWIGSWRSRPEAPISDTDRRRMIDLYDAAVRQADRLVGDVVAAVERSGRAERTLFVLTSDHGKELGERGIIEHGHSLQEELLDIPLILAGPGVPVGVRTAPAMQVDLVPTLWNLLGFSGEHPVQGRDLLELAGDDGRPLLAELDWQHTRFAYREGSRKWLAEAARPERDWERAHTADEFDLESDPDELAPLPVNPEREARAFAARSALRALGASLATDAGGSRSIDEASAQPVQALGYAVESESGQ